jgi:DNA-directed RNA polymerase specialized sigma24 family protein
MDFLDLAGQFLRFFVDDKEQIMEKKEFLDLPDRREFDAISERILNKVREFVGHESLAKQITSDIQVSLVKEELREADLDAWIKRRVESQTESHISELWDYCFHYALKLTSDPDLAQDTTQTVMVAFLQARQEVVHIKGWLRQAVYNQCMLAVKEDIKLQELGKKLQQEPVPAPMGAAIDEEQLESSLGDADLKRLLSKPEFMELKEMRSYKTLKEFAEAKGMNSSAARKRKHCILTNLKAAYLNEQGWVNIPEILDYRTLVNIKRFLNTLVEKNRLGDHKQLYHYCNTDIVPKLKESLKNVKNFSDWGISQISPKSYQVSILDLADPATPSLAVIEISINRANYIRITDCYGTALIGVIPESKLDHYPTEKGKCKLTLEDVYRYTH